MKSKKVSKIKTFSSTELDNIITNSLYESLSKYYRNYRVVPVVLLIVFFFAFGVNKEISMEPTIIHGDASIVYKYAKIERGDIVNITTDEGIRFYNPSRRNVLSKRVIAIGGDTIKFSNGEVYINDEIIEENYIKGETYYSFYEKEKTIEISDDSYFVMGDNREFSLDSRYYGEFKKKQVIGKVFIIIPTGKFKERRLINER